MYAKNAGRSSSRRDLLDNDYYQGFDRQDLFPRSSYRSRPKELPIVSQNIRQAKMRSERSSERRSERRSDKERGRRDPPERRKEERDRSDKSERRRKRRGGERLKKEDVIIEKHMDNPFHENFNKVIENPFLKAKEVKAEIVSSEDNESIFNSTNQWEVGGDSFGQAEGTVNTAIVDIYDSEEGCDPFLKMRVITLFLGPGV